MKCYVCGNRLNEHDFCTSCGTDVTMYKHIMCMSNRLYNDGLEKANVRDLSGAIVSLNESLKYNKANIDARNLLGLCYFERGEAVLALSEWIISKNYESKKNIADDYIKAMQSNPSKLETINQTIKKYNQALYYCYQNSQDLAIIQLKKVLSINENLISGYQLLALLYMEAEDYEKARRTLLRAIRIDTNDTTTQRYLKEINRVLAEQAERSGGKKNAQPQDIITFQNGNDTIIQPMYIKERRSFSSIINIIIGLVIGLAISWYLILPTRLESATKDNDEKFISVSEELASEKASNQELKKAIETNDEKIKELNAQIAELTGERGVEAENDALLKAANTYVNNPQDAAAVVDTLSIITDDYVAGATDAYRTLYENLKSLASGSAASDFASEAREALKTKDYEKAIELYGKVCELDPENSDNLMSLAYAYRESGDVNAANEVYNRVISEFPDTSNAVDAAEFISTADSDSGE